MNRQIKIGSVIAYSNIALNLIVNFILTPFMLSHLGESEYGVFKIVQSFTGQLAIMSFGLGSVTARYIVVYNTQHKIKEKRNFLFIIYSISIFLSISVIVIGLILYFFMDSIYANSLTSTELRIGKQLCLILIFNVAFSVLCDSFTGILRAYERFVVSNLISTFRLILRMTSIIVLLSVGMKSVSIVLTDLIITISVFLFCFLYSRFKLNEKAKLFAIDKILLKEIFTFSFAVLLQAIVNQVNQNLDNTVLGILTNTSLVTVYSVALTLYNCFISMVTAMSSMFGPKATKLVASGASGAELTDFVCVPGRIQTLVAFLGIFGFVVVGKDFIYLWMGEGFDDVYGITLILIVPAVIPLIESVTNTILDAMLKRMARSLALIVMCVINIVSSVIFIRFFGYIGAAFGTAFSIIIGHGVIINIYLHRKIGLNIPVMFKKIFKGILPAFLLCLIIGFFMSYIPGQSLLQFVLKTLFTVLVYSSIMYILGLNASEKKDIKHLLNMSRE